MILSPSELSRETLPPVHSLLFGGNFIVLHINLKQDTGKSGDGMLTQNNVSYIDIGFGDGRKTFAGFHRFEVTRENSGSEERKSDVSICYSTMACNPTTTKAPTPKFTYTFHKLYAWTLFCDGVAGVLRRSIR
jgi:hypothetical protein